MTVTRPVSSRTRFPRVFVSFLGENTLEIDSGNQLYSVTVNKNLNSPAGSFDILMLPAGNPGSTGEAQRITKSHRLRNQEGDRGESFSDPTSGIVGDHEAAWWMDRIEPMTLVQIVFTDGEPQTSLPESFKLDSGIEGIEARFDKASRAPVRPIAPDSNRGRTPFSSQELLAGATATNLEGGALFRLKSIEAEALGPQVPKQVVMFGLVDYVGIEKRISGNKVRRFVRIIGRDFGKIFMDDQWYNQMNELVGDDLSAPLAVFLGEDAGKARGELFRRHVFTRQGQIGTPTEEGGDQVGGRTNPWTSLNTIQYVLDYIFLNLPSYDVQLANGRHIRDYFPRPIVRPNLEGVKLFSGISLGWSLGKGINHSGNLWQLMKNLVNLPFAELFVDTVGPQNILIARRPPFGREYPDQEEVAGLFRAGAKIFDEDEFLNEPLRVVSLPKGERFHTVGDDEIISMVIGRSDKEVITFYRMTPGGLGPLKGGSAGLVPIVFDTSLTKRFGLRPLALMHKWFDPKSHVDSAEFAQSSIFENIRRDLARIYFYYRDNKDYLAGSIVMRGRSEIRVGDRVFLKGERRIFYVESVQNRWAWGTPYISTLRLTRGQPMDISNPFDVRQRFGGRTRIESRRA